MSAGKTVETMHFFICFTLRCFQFLKRLRSFLRQWICYHRPVLSAYWSPSTVSKRSSASLASKAPLTFPFGPRNANQQQQNCPNSPLQGRAPNARRAWAIDVNWWKNGIFRQYFGLRRCEINVQLFSNMLFDLPTLNHERVSLVGSFESQSEKFIVLCSEHCQTAL